MIGCFAHLRTRISTLVLSPLVSSSLAATSLVPSPLAPSSLVLLTAILLVPGASLLAQPFGFLSWSTADGLPQSQVYALAEDDQGFIWAGTQGGGVARFDGDQFEVFTVANGLPDNFIEEIYQDDSRIVVYTKQGAAFFDQRERQFVELKDWEPKRQPVLQLRPEIPTPVAELKLADGRYLVASRTKGLYLTSASGKVLEHYTENNSDLPHNSVRALLQDRQGRFWLGTSGGGLVRMIPTGIRHYDQSDGLIDPRVYALHRDGNRLWLGGRKRGMQYLDSTGFHRPPVDDPTVETKITSITQDATGAFTFFSTDGKGVTALDDSLRVERLTRRSGLAADWVLKLLPGEDNTTAEVWAATYTEGISHIVYRDSNFVITNYNLPEDDQPLRLASAIRDGNQTFFLGTTSGEIHQWRWRPAQRVMRTTVLGKDNGLPEAPVKALALRRGTQLWAAVTGHGLFYTDLRMEQPRFFPLPARLKEENRNIFQLTAPPDRPEIWIGTQNGLDRMFLNQDGQPDHIRHYGPAEGFLGGETTGASLIDPDGAIWFGTMNGLARYEESNVEGYLEPPPTFLAGVDLFYKPVEATDYTLTNGVPVFRARDSHFNFRFRAVDLTYPQRIRYRYRMSGVQNNEWSPLTAETAIRYAGLSPGTHTFEVAATTDGGNTYGEPVTYSFRIDSPLLRQPWFLGVLALLSSTLLIGGFYTFYQRLQRKEAARRRKLESRNQMLELEQKALRLQMNPHFIFNALNGIRGLVDGEHDAEARQQISRFAALMRGILNNSRQDAIPLADEIKVLDDYLKMEQFCQPFTFTYALHLPEDIDPEEVSLPPMLLQPFVENAVLHGLSGKAEGGHIDVSFALRGRRMQCLVEDNGIGRKAAAERRKSRAPGHKSVALAVTRARLQAMKGRLTISDRTGGGTSVEVLVPVELW